MAKFDAERLFGIEIEFLTTRRSGTSVNPTVLAEMITDAGVECHAEGYNHDGAYGPTSTIGESRIDRNGLTTRTYWKIVSDMSCGWELVSPPMKGEEGKRQLKVVTDVLHSYGAKVNSRCGMHVHHDGRKLLGEQIADVVMMYEQHHGTIDAMLPQSRTDSWAAKKRTTYRVRRNLDGVQLKDKSAAVKQEVINSLSRDRYVSVNTVSLRDHGTIEFRQHQGTLNFKKIWSWVVFTQMFINASLKYARYNYAKDDGGILSDRAVKHTNRTPMAALKYDLMYGGHFRDDDETRDAVAHMEARFNRGNTSAYVRTYRAANNY
jgi:hypothetical protein